MQPDSPAVGAVPGSLPTRYPSLRTQLLFGADILRWRPILSQPLVTMGDVARHASDVPNHPAVVVVNPDDDVTAESFRAWLDHRQASEPTSPAVRAADTLAELRALGEA
jgi:hypothetical protein